MELSSKLVILWCLFALAYIAYRVSQRVVETRKLRSMKNIDLSEILIYAQKTPQGFKINGTEVITDDLKYALSVVLNIQYMDNKILGDAEGRYVAEFENGVRRPLLLIWRRYSASA